jgi:hydrogenase maturation protease
MRATGRKPETANRQPATPSSKGVPARARIVGLGQAAAGDDGVGLAVIEWLQAHGVPEGVELLRAREDSALIDLLDTDVPVIVVDAVLHEPAGEVLDLMPGELAARTLLPLSTHGMGVPEAIELTRLVATRSIAPSIRIVAVSIARPRRYRQHLSAPVAAAVSRAGQRVLAMVGG